MLLTFLDPIAHPVPEKTSGTFFGRLVQNDGVTPLGSSVLSTLVLTVYVIKSDGTEQTIRNHQTILNANNGTIDTSGNLAWVYQPADTTLVEDLPTERHLCLFEWTWSGGAGKHESVLVVKNLHQVL